MSSSQNLEQIQELLPISEKDGKKAVNARMLHAFLKSKREFSTWIKDRIQKYDFVENQDFVSFDEIVKRETGASIRTEYALSLNCAKEIAMVEGNVKGKQARQYFIECEQQLKEVTKTFTSAEMFLQNAQLMVEHDKRITDVESKLHVLEAKTITRPEEFTIAGYATLNGMHVNLAYASKLGRAAKDLCRKRNIQTGALPDPRFGRVCTYPSMILKEVFNLPIN